MSDSPKFLNPRSDISFQKNRLPHWEQGGCSYFITFRLADSLPMHLLEAWKSEREVWLNLHPKPWTPEFEREYHERFSGASPSFSWEIDKVVIVSLFFRKSLMNVSKHTQRPFVVPNYLFYF